jgi:ABC-type bacteriocin/lantibiotic exporter with double-glycine peptidase domain
MKIKPIKQRDASACGPTCIEMALRYFGIIHTVKSLTEVTNYKQAGGMSNMQIAHSLQALGLKTKLHKNTSWESLIKLNAEGSVLIVSWMLEGYIGHVSVVEKVTDTHIFMAEPTTGKVTRVEKIKFLRLWWDYEAQDRDIWYPESKSDIQLRLTIIVTK